MDVVEFLQPVVQEVQLALKIHLKDQLLDNLLCLVLFGNILRSYEHIMNVVMLLHCQKRILVMLDKSVDKLGAFNLVLPLDLVLLDDLLDILENCVHLCILSLFALLLSLPLFDRLLKSEQRTVGQDFVVLIPSLGFELLAEFVVH